MKGITTILDEMMKPGASIPKPLVDRLLDTTMRSALQQGHADEREELVCRLLASAMPVDEISLILKIRAEEIRIIEHNNKDRKIPDYEKKLKARRKGREREALRRQEMDAIINQRKA